MERPKRFVSYSRFTGKSSRLGVRVNTWNPHPEKNIANRFFLDDVEETF